MNELELIELVIWLSPSVNEFSPLLRVSQTFKTIGVGFKFDEAVYQKLPACLPLMLGEQNYTQPWRRWPCSGEVVVEVAVEVVAVVVEVVVVVVVGFISKIHIFPLTQKV